MPRSATRASTCRWTCALRSPPKVAEVALGERRVRADLPGERTLVQQDAHDHCDAVLQASGQQMLLRRLVEHVIDACRGTRRPSRPPAAGPPAMPGFVPYGAALSAAAWTVENGSKLLRTLTPPDRGGKPSSTGGWSHSRENGGGWGRCGMMRAGCP